jgi:hypothetical protein
MLFDTASKILSMIISPTHIRTEGRAPVWSSEFTIKVARYMGDSAETAAGLKRNLLDLTDDWWCQLTPKQVFDVHNFRKRSSENLVVERGVAGRAGAMRAIAPSMPPQACPRQGRRRPTPILFLPLAPTVETCVSGRAPATKLRPTTLTR